MTSVDLQQATVTALFTVATGVIVFLFKTIVDEYWVSHLREYKKLKAEIAFNLVKYANIYSNAEVVKKETADVVAKTIRDMAAKVAAFVETRPIICWDVPRSDQLLKASSSLIGLSNITYAQNRGVHDHREFIDKQIQEIKKLLKMKAFS